MTAERWEALPLRSVPVWLGLVFCFCTTAVLWHFALNRLLDGAGARPEAARLEPAKEQAAAAAPPPPGVGAEPSSMALVPAGVYQPFYKDQGGGKPVPVRPFLLDVLPVSRGQFLDFVRRVPGFRKTRIQRLFAEQNYLADWAGDLAPGSDLDAPVTYVSWFAAKAYCEHRGKRLPTTSEWERTAGKSAAPERPAAAARGQSPFRFAMGKAEPEANGVRGFGSVWEWTSDFNSVLVSGRLGDGRSAASAFCGDGIRATDPSDYGAFLRYSFRASLKADYTLKSLGFRCAKQPD